MTEVRTLCEERMIWFIVIFLLILLFFLAELLIFIGVFYSPFKSQGNIHRVPKGEQYRYREDYVWQITEELAARTFEKAEIASFDGLTLFARCYEQNKKAPVMLCFHGYRATSIRDFCGGGKTILEAGFNLILADQRACGKSSGHTITFGVKEQYDCLAWIDYANSRFPGCDIILYGVSMGASTVLLAGAHDLPENVRGIIADCPFSSPEKIIRKVSRDIGFPPGIFYPLVRLSARIFGDFDPSSENVTDKISKIKVPVMLIHGSEDLFVPCQMSVELKKAGKTAELYIFPDAGHALSYLKDSEKYSMLIKEFSEKVCKNHKTE